MSEVKVNKISPRTNCGTVTLGDSGDTITIPAGVTITNNGTQTGFGRSGSVDWQTSIKTTDFTAVSGEGYFVNTTSGTITVTLPSSPSAGAIVSIKDYANTADTNAITIARNGSNIDGSAEDVDMVVEGIAVTIVYADATKGWLVVESGQKTDLVAPQYISATGGDITTVCTNFKVHTFTGPGTFTVCSAGNPAGSNTVDYLVIAGGGGSTWDNGGGGGAGGYRESSGAASGCYSRSPLGACVSALPVSAQGYPIVVGGGGAGLAPPGPGPGGRGGDGNTSSFSTISSAGGGGGGLCSTFCAPAAGSGIGNPGGSGGGAGQTRNVTSAAGGTGNTPPVSPPQGNPGGTGNNPPGGNNHMGAAGGGGATAAGTGMTHPTPQDGKAGGAGATSSITGSPVGRAGGGGGGVGQPGIGSGGTATDGGGAGGGSPAGPGPAANAGTDGTDNTGGGAGGGGQGMDGSANGGSGIVIIRYKFQ